MNEPSAFPLWFPFLLVGGWLLVGALLSGLSHWPELACRFPGVERPAGTTLRGQVVGIGLVNENNVTTLVVAPTGLYLSANVLFRFRRPPILLPWGEVRFVSERKVLWWRNYVLDLGGVTEIRIKARAFAALEPFLIGSSSAAAGRARTVA